jgi:hypothetical protein
VHRERLGGNHMHFSREKKYRIPENLIRYLCGFPDPDVVRCVADTLYRLQIRAPGHVSFEGLDDNEEANRTELARQIALSEDAPHFVRRVVQAEKPVQGEDVDTLRAEIRAEYGETVFSDKPTGPPPVRGPFGEATITLKPGAVPVKQRMYQIHGERRAAWSEGIEKMERELKLEDGVSA